MKRYLPYIFFFLILFFKGNAQENDKYRLVLLKNASVELLLKESGKRILLSPEFILLHRETDSRLHYEKYVRDFADGVTVPAWNQVHDGKLTADYFRSAYIKRITAKKAKLTGNRIEWVFGHDDLSDFQAYLELSNENELPVIRYTFKPRKQGYYSVAFAGLPAYHPGSLDALWQPWIWQEKRFPLTSYLSTEEMSPLPAILVQKDGFTQGLIADPSQLPFRLPNQKTGNIRFGSLLRNKTGQAQPMIFAPVMGNPDSKMDAGSVFSFTSFILFDHKDITTVHRYVAEKIYHFSDYRVNVYTNLNQTLSNMADFAMDDINSGWNPEFKGFDYTKDVSKTIKTVSGLHPLSIAVITDDEDMYNRRAIPMIQFNLSRERFLFTIHQGEAGQNASGNMDGPGIEVAELCALNNYYRGRMPVFAYFADSLRNAIRILNLNTKSDGNSWQNLTGLYKMNHDSSLLKLAMLKTQQYINKRIDTLQTDFSLAGVDAKGTLSSGDLTSQFTTDYTPKWIELLDLYELTKHKAYLDAAVKGARLFTQFIWFSPMIPENSLVIDSHNVPAWQVSQIGLTPEASNTFNHNPAIYLAHFAAHFLRLAYYTGDNYYRSIARSAIIGRYSNFPGYTISGKFGITQARPDYPINPSLHGSFYYNHIWPQLALLYDYLVSDAFAQSKGHIDFPGELAPAYAYLKSKVYGQQPGRFYTDSNIYLYMPRQLLQLDNEQVNYVSAYGNGNFYICLLNQSDSVVHVSFSLNPSLTSVNRERIYNVRTWKENTPVADQKMEYGKISFDVAAKGITACAIDGATALTTFQNRIYKDTATVTNNSYSITQTPFGKISATLFSIEPTRQSAYLWLQAKSLQNARLYYRCRENEDWHTTTDKEFPFEFSVTLPQEENQFIYKLELKANSGEVFTTDTLKISRY